MATKPFRSDSGVAFSTGTASWQGPTGVGGIYYQTGVGLVMRKTDNTEVTLGGGGGSTGNWTFSGNNADLSGAATMGLGLATATAMSVGNSSFGSLTLTGARMLISQRALTTGTQQSALAITGGAHTALTASTEQFDVNFSLNRTVQWSTGSFATQRAFVVQAPTFAFVGGSTITNAATMAISGAPVAGTNATLTNSWALWLQTGNLGMAPAASIASSSQGTTNTVGMTMAPNVADGASSIALDVNCGTTLTTSGARVARFRNNGTTLWSMENTAFGYPTLMAGGATFGILTTGTSGMKADDTNGVDIFTGTVPRVNITGTGLVPSADNTYSSGSVAARWSNTFSARYTTLTQTVAAAASLTINPANGAHVRITLSATAITSLTVSAGGAGERVVVEVIQDGTGSRTIPTTWTNVTFPGGTYTATTAANKRDKITLDYDATDSKWYATVTANL